MNVVGKKITNGQSLMSSANKPPVQTTATTIKKPVQLVATNKPPVQTTAIKQPAQIASATNKPPVQTTAIKQPAQIASTIIKNPTTVASPLAVTGSKIPATTADNPEDEKMLQNANAKMNEYNFKYSYFRDNVRICKNRYFTLFYDGVNMLQTCPIEKYAKYESVICNMPTIFSYPSCLARINTTPTSELNPELLKQFWKLDNQNRKNIHRDNAEWRYLTTQSWLYQFNADLNQCYDKIMKNKKGGGMFDFARGVVNSAKGAVISAKNAVGASNADDIIHTLNQKRTSILGYKTFVEYYHKTIPDVIFSDTTKNSCKVSKLFNAISTNPLVTIITEYNVDIYSRKSYSQCAIFDRTDNSPETKCLRKPTVVNDDLFKTIKTIISQETKTFNDFAIKVALFGDLVKKDLYIVYSTYILSGLSEAANNEHRKEINTAIESIDAKYNTKTDEQTELERKLEEAKLLETEYAGVKSNLTKNKNLIEETQKSNPVQTDPKDEVSNAQIALNAAKIKQIETANVGLTSQITELDQKISALIPSTEVSPPSENEDSDQSPSLTLDKKLEIYKNEIDSKLYNINNEIKKKKDSEMETIQKKKNGSNEFIQLIQDTFDLLESDILSILKKYNEWSLKLRTYPGFDNKGGYTHKWPKLEFSDEKIKLASFETVKKNYFTVMEKWSGFYKNIVKQYLDNITHMHEIVDASVRLIMDLKNNTQESASINQTNLKQYLGINETTITQMKENMMKFKFYYSNYYPIYSDGSATFTYFETNRDLLSSPFCRETALSKFNNKQSNSNDRASKYGRDVGGFVLVFASCLLAAPVCAALAAFSSGGRKSKKRAIQRRSKLTRHRRKSCK
jgi:hypothetical protein